MNKSLGIVTLVSLVFWSALSSAEVASSGSGFPGGSTSLFASSENPNLRSSFGTNSAPTAPGTATNAPIGNPGSLVIVPPSGAADQGFVAGTPQALGETNPLGGIQSSGAADQGFVSSTPQALGEAGTPFGAGANTAVSGRTSTGIAPQGSMGGGTADGVSSAIPATAGMGRR